MIFRLVFFKAKYKLVKLKNVIAEVIYLFYNQVISMFPDLDNFVVLRKNCIPFLETSSCFKGNKKINSDIVNM